MSRVPQGSVVLRDLPLVPTPHLLARPGVRRPDIRLPAGAGSDADSDRYQEGLLAGRAAADSERAAADAARQRSDAARALAAATAEGLRLGRAQAAEEQQAHALALADQHRQLDALAAGLTDAHRQLIAVAEDDLLGLAFAAVGRLLGAAAPSPEQLQILVQQAVRELGEAALIVHLHPDDLELLRESKDPAQPGVEWRADASLSLGGVRVEGRHAQLDAGFERQLRTLADAWLATRALCRAGGYLPDAST